MNDHSQLSAAHYRIPTQAKESLFQALSVP